MDDSIVTLGINLTNPFFWLDNYFRHMMTGHPEMSKEEVEAAWEDEYVTIFNDLNAKPNSQLDPLPAYFFLARSEFREVPIKVCFRYIKKRMLIVTAFPVNEFSLYFNLYYSKKYAKPR